MRQYKSKILIIPIIILNLVLFSIYSAANPPMNNVVIDGIINESEWSGADWKINFYLDVDNTPDFNGKINVDGENVLYLGEDLNNIYLALDLCSDRSDNETGEWIGVWLNTANRTFDNYFDWVTFFDNGVETLIHDVEENQPWKYYSEDAGIYTEHVNDDTEIIPTYGKLNGTADFLTYWWTPDFVNITSEPVGAYDIFWVNFSVDLSNWYPFPDEISDIQRIQIRVGTEHSVSIDEHKLILWNSDSTLPALDDPQQVISLNNQNSYLLELHDYGLANLTVDNKLQFSLYANNSSPFSTRLERLDFNVYRNYTNYAGNIWVPHSTITSYQLDWSFGSSPNNATDHRMFEFSIPKVELEHYNSNEELGIIVGGYGTLGYINGSNFWVFSTIDYWQHVEDSSYYNYYNMKGVESPGVISGYPLIMLIGITSVCSIVVIKKKFK
ncbi:MAG: hypothetical protein ACFE8G_13830 [Candidatus Hermodarchaeota archaeon]